MRKKLGVCIALLVVVLAVVLTCAWLWQPQPPVPIGMEWHEVRATMERKHYSRKDSYPVTADGQPHNTSRTARYLAEEYDSPPDALGNVDVVVIQVDRETLHVCRLTVRPGPSLLDRVKKKFGL